jgi:predicted TIM-barrel fold metal-dependent hydrolase
MVYTHQDFEYIDSHVHFFPPNLFKAIWDFFETPAENGQSRGWSIKYKLEIEELVEFLKSEKVTAFTTYNYAHKKGIAENINEWTYHFCKNHPEAIAFGCVWPGDDNKLDYVRKIIDEYNFQGLKLQLLVQDFYPNDKRMLEIYKFILDGGKWINMHCGTAPYSNKFVGFKHFIKLIQKFPDLKIIVAHFGAYEHEKFFKLMDTHDNLFLDTAMVYVPSNLFTKWNRNMKYPDRELLISYQDRILYGSDFPNIPYNYEVSTKGLLDLDLERGILQKIFSENARKIFNVSK